MYNIEYSKYEEFIKVNYPSSDVYLSDELSSIHKSIYQNILFMNFAAKNETKKNSERDIFYQDFINISLRILYVLPLKDIYLNRILSRALVECTAKITLSYFSDVSDIQSMNMKKIKEELKKKGVHVRYRELYETITAFFGEFSTDVHGRNISTEYDNSFLYELLNSNKDIFLSDLEKINKKINTAIMLCYPEMIVYDKSTHNMASLSSIMEIE